MPTVGLWTTEHCSSSLRCQFSTLRTCSPPIQFISFQLGYQDTRVDHAESLANVKKKTTSTVLPLSAEADHRQQSGCLGVICLLVNPFWLFSRTFRGALSSHMQGNSSSICSIIFPGGLRWGWLLLLPHIVLAPLEGKMTSIFLKSHQEPPWPSNESDWPFSDTDQLCQHLWVPLPGPLGLLMSSWCKWYLAACSSSTVLLNSGFGFPIPRPACAGNVFVFLSCS